DLAVDLVGQAEPFIVVMHGDRQNLLGPVLADDVLVELLLDGAGRRDVGQQRFGAAAAAFFLIDDRLAQLDALATNVHVARPFDEGTDVAVTVAAKRTVGVAIAARAAGGPPSACPRARVFGRHAVSFVSVSRIADWGLRIRE